MITPRIVVTKLIRSIPGWRRLRLWLYRQAAWRDPLLVRGPFRGPDGHTAMPEEFDEGHNLCYANHDVMLELLKSGEEVGAFKHHVPLSDSEAKILNEAEDIFTWMEQASRQEELAPIIRAVAFPALLSDFLHFIYEALQASRKGKLTVAYSLLRKPIQENLYLLENIAIDLHGFTTKLAVDPSQLGVKNVGGHEGHVKRIAAVLDILGETDRFDADYIAQLRYMKCEDGFDGYCNLAMHLFTSHKDIKTEKLNINFIFSDSAANLTQWAYLYSRMPYLLFYARRLVEYVFSTIFDRTAPNYLSDIERRVQAATILWWPTLDATYQDERLRRFVVRTRLRLRAESRTAGFGTPRFHHLPRMMADGAWPDEPAEAVARRLAGYAANARSKR